MYVHPEVFILLAVFIFKHYLADYPFQSLYMGRKCAPGWGWVVPLSAHAGVHAGMTAAILTGFNIYCVLAQIGALSGGAIAVLSALDFALHFVMDRIKASPNLLGQFRTLSPAELQKALTGLRSPNQKARLASSKNIRNNKYYWWSFGFDQAFHHWSDLLVVALVFMWGLK